MRGGRRRHVMILGALLGATVGVAAWRSRRDRVRPEEETARVRALYDRAASRYDAIVRIAERLLVADGRLWAARRAAGDVLEIAIGTGRNIPCYSPDVRLAGQDISRPMLQLARPSPRGKAGRRAERRRRAAAGFPGRAVRLRGRHAGPLHHSGRAAGAGGGVARAASRGAADSGRARAEPPAARAAAAGAARAAGRLRRGRSPAARSAGSSHRARLRGRILRAQPGRDRRTAGRSEGPR